MSSQEKMELPEPLKIDKNILNQLDDLEKTERQFMRLLENKLLRQFFNYILLKNINQNVLLNINL